MVLAGGGLVCGWRTGARMRGQDRAVTAGLLPQPGCMYVLSRLTWLGIETSQEPRFPAAGFKRFLRKR
jgi:hypothetical protein